LKLHDLCTLSCERFMAACADLHQCMRRSASIHSHQRQCWIDVDWRIQWWILRWRIKRLSYKPHSAW
jgi:hypothetical protein